jgi:hypothetical protein
MDHGVPRAPRSRPTIETGLAEFAKLVASSLIAFVADEVARQRATLAASKYVTQQSGLLSKRKFLAAARRGDFESFCVGKDRYARTEDVIAFIERKPYRSVEARRGPNADARADVIGDLLDRAGTRRSRKAR